MIPAIESPDGLGLTPWLGVIAAYALGCFNTGYYFIRWKTGQDIRLCGSGNAGAANVGRMFGPWSFGITLIGDMAKGALAVHYAQLGGLSLPVQVPVIAAVVAGHNWPAQLEFHGGKGVASSCGALLFFDPLLAALLLVVCAVLIAVTRRFTLGAMVAYALTPVVAVTLGYNVTVIALLAALAGLVVFPHQQDLRAELSRRPPSPKV
jgi:glycerol-3-phosphate acyltransferase PlsY